MITRLIELADDRKEIIRDLRNYHDVYLHHLIKIYFMRDHQELNHWIREAWIYYHSVRKLRNNKLPKESLIFQHICGCDEDVIEFWGVGYIYSILVDLYEYDFSKEVTDRDVHNFRLFYIEYSKFVAENLSKNKIIYLQDSKDKIKELLNKYEY